MNAVGLSSSCIDVSDLSFCIVACHPALLVIPQVGDSFSLEIPGVISLQSLLEFLYDGEGAFFLRWAQLSVESHLCAAGVEYSACEDLKQVDGPYIPLSLPGFRELFLDPFALRDKCN